MAAGAGATAGLRFSGGSSGALAPHVIAGHADLASAGVRSLLLLREALRRWAGPERTASVAGELLPTFTVMSHYLMTAAGPAVREIPALRITRLGRFLTRFYL